MVHAAGDNGFVHNTLRVFSSDEPAKLLEVRDGEAGF
jgi:hypothetical protein